MLSKLMTQYGVTTPEWVKKWIYINSEPRQCLSSLVVKLGTFNLSPGQSTNLELLSQIYRQANIEENQIRSELSHKLHDKIRATWIWWNQLRSNYSSTHYRVTTIFIIFSQDSFVFQDHLFQTHGWNLYLQNWPLQIVRTIDDPCQNKIQLIWIWKDDIFNTIYKCYLETVIQFAIGWNLEKFLHSLKN